MSSAEPDASNVLPDQPQLRDLFSFNAGGRTFAVFAEEVEGTADAKHVAGLPHAPPAVLGILCVRGRMLTALDPIALLTGERLTWPRELPCVVALRGDEQLALAAESFGSTITISATDIEIPGDDDQPRPAPVVGISRHGGEEIRILSVPDLFAAAFQRKERRRRRF